MTCCDAQRVAKCLFFLEAEDEQPCDDEDLLRGLLRPPDTLPPSSRKPQLSLYLHEQE